MRSEAAHAAEARAVVQRLGEPHFGEVAPSRQQHDSEQRQQDQPGSPVTDA